MICEKCGNEAVALWIENDIIVCDDCDGGNERGWINDDYLYTYENPGGFNTTKTNIENLIFILKEYS